MITDPTNPMLGADKNKGEAMACLERHQMLLVDPHWLMRLIEHAQQLETALLALSANDPTHGDGRVKVQGVPAEQRSGGLSPLEQQMAQAGQATGLEWLEKKANRADL